MHAMMGDVRLLPDQVVKLTTFGVERGCRINRNCALIFYSVLSSVRLRDYGHQYLARRLNSFEYRREISCQNPMSRPGCRIRSVVETLQLGRGFSRSTTAGCSVDRVSAGIYRAPGFIRGSEFLNRETWRKRATSLRKRPEATTHIIAQIWMRGLECSGSSRLQVVHRYGFSWHISCFGNLGNLCTCAIIDMRGQRKP